MWPPLSSSETSPDRERWCRHAQLLGWMMYHQESGPQSRHALYLLQQHQRSLGIPDLQLASTVGARGALTPLSGHTYRDRRPGSRGLYLLEVSLFNFCFLNKGIYDFGFEKVRHSVWTLGCKEWIRNAFVLSHTCIWTRESDSIGMGTSKKKNTLQLGPKLSYNLDLDQVVYLLSTITDLDVCLSLFFCQTPRGEFFRFGTSMGWLDLGFRGSNVKVAVIPPA